MKTIILSAGQGRRLLPLTEETPKSVLPVGDKSALGWQLDALQEAGFAHAAVDVLAVELPHRPGALSQLARVLADENVVIRYAYATNPLGGEYGLCIMRVDDIHRAQQVLNKKLTK